METTWCVEVTVNGESVLEIGHDWIYGNAELTEADERAIRAAGNHLLAFVGEQERSREMDGPTKNTEHYNPLNHPKRYPLELDNRLHICLWGETGQSTWTTAYFVNDKEGPELKFVGDRPLDRRVDWDDLRVVVELGYCIAKERWGADNES